MYRNKKNKSNLAHNSTYERDNIYKNKLQE